MKINLIIASEDTKYSKHISQYLSEFFADTFAVAVCTNKEMFAKQISSIMFDIALVEATFIPLVNSNVKLPLLLWENGQDIYNDIGNYIKVKKHQRITTIASELLQNFAKIAPNYNSMNGNSSKVTVVWSPCGGVGKTTVALAYAANRIARGKKVLYLNLENFSSVETYFNISNESISTVFESFESNLEILLKAIVQTDDATRIMYFSPPNNYDDINILSKEDLIKLIDGCSLLADEIVVDISSQCNSNAITIFEIANTILLVIENTITSHKKLFQFLNQNSIAQKQEEKLVLVQNKGASLSQTKHKKISLPHINSNNAVAVFKALSSSNFEF